MSQNTSPNQGKKFSGSGKRGMGVIEKPKDFKKSLKKLTVFMGREKKRIIFSIILSFVAAVFSLIGPLFLGKITDSLHLSLKLGTSLDINYISFIALALLIMYFISLVSNYFQGFLMSKVSGNISKKMREDISIKINKLPLKYFDNVSTGDIMSKITNDVSTVSNTFSQSFASILISIVRVLGFIVVMFVISWQLTLITLASLPLTFVTMSLIMKRSQKHFVKQQTSLGQLNGQAEESYSGFNVIKAFNAEEKMINQFENINNDLYTSGYKSTFMSGIIQPIAVFFSNITYLVVCLVGAGLVFNEVILIGAIASFVLYIRQINHPISTIASIAGTLQSTVASAERVFDILEAEEEESEKDKQVTFKQKEVKGKVEFRQVCFGYDKDKEIIHNFNFVMSPGEKIAIVGPTGAGKTTLINLLMRFYEINSGDILIDNISIKEMKRKDVRKLFGMVLQDTWLFEGTIKENVSYGVSKITAEEVEKVCQKANIDHFVKTLPNDYSTILDDSANLSQGQRQLVTIARAMIQNAPMLILDEATSSVDTRTEILIQEAMDRLTKGRTSFVIAHRLSTIKNASKIIVMNEGKIVEIGNHEELLAKNGFYAELYNSQFDE